MKEKFARAFRGLFAAIKEELSLKIHLAAFAAVSILCIYLEISLTEYALVLLFSSMVISLELINTALEKLCDRLHPERHKAIAFVKDVSAAGVLVAAAGAFIFACIFLLPKLFERLNISLF